MIGRCCSQLKSQSVASSRRTRMNPSCSQLSLFMVNLSTTIPLQNVFVDVLYCAYHAALVGNSLKRQAGALLRLASTSWGYDRQTLCYRHRYRALKGGVQHIFVAAVDIELNTGESRSITTLRRIGHHWPASYYSCRGHPIRSEPPIDKDKGSQLSTIAMEKSQR